MHLDVKSTTPDLDINIPQKMTFIETNNIDFNDI